MRNMAIAMAVCAASALVATGTDMTYVKQGGGPYLWSDASAWYDVSGATAQGRVPAAGDSVTLYGAFSPDAPIRIPSDCNADVDALNIGSGSYGADGNLLCLTIEDRGTLTTKAASEWGNRAGTNVVELQEGATATFDDSVYAGREIGSAVIVTNRGSATFNGALLFGYSSRGYAAFENFGTLEINGALRLANSWSGKGVPTTGILHLHEGSVVRKTLKNITGGYNYTFVGRSGYGEMIVENTFAMPGGDQIKVASDDGGLSRGLLVVAGNGVITNSATKGNNGITIASGESSTGELKVKDGGYVYLKGIAMPAGGGSNSNARVSLSDNGTLFVSGESFIAGGGDASRGNVSVSDDAYMYVAGGSHLASGQNSQVDVDISENGHVDFRNALSCATAAGSTANISIGSGVLEIQNAFTLASGAGSTGVCHLAGGTLKLRARGLTDANVPIPFFVGTALSDGVLSGHGNIGVTTWDNNNSSTPVRRFYTYLRGRIIADGDGEDRDLDVTKLTIYNPAGEANATGTAGWYARNHGRVFFPHGTGVADGAVTIGDNATNEVPVQVNSFRVALTGATDGYYLHSALYAADRADLPGALPMAKGDVALGVWRMGYASGGQFTSTPSTAKNFTSADVTIRYGTSVLKKNRKYWLRALRWNGSAWVETSSFPVTKDSPNGLVTFSGLEPVSDGSKYNIGWTALVAQKVGGFVLSFR